MANPPVCRIMDYGKFRYEEAQKAKEARKKTTHVTVKEVKFRPKIGKGDFDTKMRHLLEFLDEGHKVKVTLQFRGREMAHPELGQRILDGVIATAGPIAKVENQARMEGRNMSLVLAPDKKAQEALKKAALEEAKKAQEAGLDDAAAPIESPTESPTESPAESPAAEIAADVDSETDIDIETHLGLDVTANETAPPDTPGDE